MLADFRHAFRRLAATPGFALVAILALGLGIGANTAIFSVVHGVLLRPLPYPEQDRLLFVREWSEQVPGMSVAYPNFMDWRERQRSFTALGAFRSQGFGYAGAEAERLPGSMASYDIFAALGTPPLLGRLYTADEDRPGAGRTVLVSERLWRRVLGAREDALGQTLSLNGDIYTVVGVMPAAFQFPNADTDVWVPLGLFAADYANRGNHSGLSCIARLKPGVSHEAGAAEIRSIAEQLAREYPDTNARQSARAELLVDRTFGPVKGALFTLLGAAGFVLLIACANVANLQLARAHGRAREFAVRSALGASRGRVMRQLLAESLLLGSLGCVAGILFGLWGLEALRSVIPANTPRIADVSLDGVVLGFALAISLVTSVAFGLVPALFGTDLNLRETLAQGPRAGGSASGGRWRAILIVGEFALTGVLLVGAGLMLRTLANLHRADSGFSTDRTLTASWSTTGPAFADPAARGAVFARGLERLAGIPGIRHAAIVNPLPLSNNRSQATYYVEGTPLPEPGRQLAVEVFEASGNIFAALNIPLLKGRTFNEQDTPTSRRVAVVDTLFVEKHFKGQDPLGKRFTYNSGPPADESGWITIVGVVAHIRNEGLTSTEPAGEQAYRAHTQVTPRAANFVLRTDAEPAAVAPAIRAALREAAPELPVFAMLTMEERFARSIATQRLTVFLLGIFAGLAVLLAALGLYGVLAYNLGQRTRELGVRLALGATPGSLVALVLRHGLKLAGLGLALGLAAALGLTQLLRAVLYDVSAFDPASFAGVALILAAIGLFACWLPARRATKVDPMVALRAE